MAGNALTTVLQALSIMMGLAYLVVFPACAYEDWQMGRLSTDRYAEHMRRMQALKAPLPLIRHDAVFSPARAPSDLPVPAPAPLVASTFSPRIYQATSYGADPTGQSDSTEALMKAIADAFQGPNEGILITGVNNLGGAQINLEGGNFLISKPLRLPADAGNLLIQGGTLRASENFPSNGYLIDLSNSSSARYNYEYITIRDILLDANYRGGGILVSNSLRISIDNCYITHFNTNGILVRGGHETYIRNSFLGQHITAGADPGERSFSGTAINLMGNDNAVTDVVIFSAGVGIIVSGQANTFSGVHCYNKATGFGGTGIYLKLPGKTQTRIVNCYMDYTGIVAEDPVQLDISSSFFLGDAYVSLKSLNGVASGVNIVDNMFTGSNRGVAIVQLDQSNGPFKQIDQIVVDRNTVRGMNLKATVAKAAVGGNGTSWTVDFNPVLLFPNLIKHVQYTFSPEDSSFPNHALRNATDNRVVIESDVTVPANVFVTVDQGLTI